MAAAQCAGETVQFVAVPTLLDFPLSSRARARSRRRTENLTKICCVDVEARGSVSKTSHRKRQSNTILDVGSDSGYWFRAAQAAGVSSASRWMETPAKPGNTAPR